MVFLGLQTFACGSCKGGHFKGSCNEYIGVNSFVLFIIFIWRRKLLSPLSRFRYVLIGVIL